MTSMPRVSSPDVSTSMQRFSTRVAIEGADVRFVHWIGHANIQNTVIYTHLVSPAREEKARTFFLKLPRF
jgi:site-specific recombinase XerD